MCVRSREWQLRWRAFPSPPWKQSLRRRCFAWCPPQCQSCWWSVETDEDCPRCTADPGLAHHWCTIHGTSSSLDSEREKIYFIKNSLTWQNNYFTNKGDSHKCFNIFRSCFNQNERRKKYIYISFNRATTSLVFRGLCWFWCLISSNYCTQFVKILNPIRKCMFNTINLLL